MKSFYFTFGFGQPHHPGYIQIYAPDEHTARNLMFETYPRWAFCYDDLEKVHPNDRVRKGLLVFGESDIAEPKQDKTMTEKVYIRLEDEDFLNLVKGKRVKKEDINGNEVHIILADIGWDRMTKNIATVIDESISR